MFLIYPISGLYLTHMPVFPTRATRDNSVSYLYNAIANKLVSNVIFNTETTPQNRADLWVVVGSKIHCHVSEKAQYSCLGWRELSFWGGLPRSLPSRSKMMANTSVFPALHTT